MSRITPTQTTRRKVGEFRHKALALLMSVLLVLVCLPIMPGSTEEAQAETVVFNGNVTYYATYNGAYEAEVVHYSGYWYPTSVKYGTYYNTKSLTHTGSPIQWYDATGTPCADPGGTITSSSIAIGSISPATSQSPAWSTSWTKTGTFSQGSSTSFTFPAQAPLPVSYSFTLGSLSASISGSITDFNQTGSATWTTAGGGATQDMFGSITPRNISGTVAVKHTVQVNTTSSHNPIITSSPAITKTINDPIGSASDWISGITATWGSTTANTIPSLGAVTDTSLVGGTDVDLSTLGTSFDRVGVKNHTYKVEDDHALTSYLGDTTFTNANRNIIVQAATEPNFNIKYASTALDKDGTPIPGAPYNGEWTNQPLEMEASHTDPGTYDTAIRKYEPFASGTYASEASDLTNSHLINIPGYLTDSTTAAGTGFTSILEEEDPMSPGTFIDLSPETAKKMVKIDTGMPTPAATYGSGVFTDTSTDPDGLSLIDPSRQKIAIVPTGSAPPTNYNTDFKTFAAMNASPILPGYYDVYVWAWDNAGNNTSTLAINNQLIVSTDSPTIEGTLASGPNNGQVLASGIWTNQDVEVEVTPPASITNGYSALFDGLTLENKATVVNTPVSKIYTAETPGTTLDGVILDSGTTELSQHSSNYVVMIDKTDPVAGAVYNGFPTYDFADASTDTASMVAANSGVNPAETIICFDTPGSMTPPAKSSYEPLIGATLPANGWYDVWVIATDYAGNESTPVKAYDHIARSGLDEINAKDFAWDIAKGSAIFDDAMTRMLSRVEGIPYGSNTPFPLTSITVDPGELAAIVSAINLGLKGTTHDLTFSTPGGLKQATTTVKVTLFDSGSNIPTPPTPLTQELIFANDFNWGISTGNITPDDSRALSKVVGYKLNGDKFATGDLLVDATELQAINDAIDAGQKDTTHTLTFRTDGSTGPAASVTINVTLFDNGPIGPIPANAEHIVGNNFAWGISTGLLSDAEAYFLGNINPTSATGAPFTQANVTADAGELSDINDAITAGQIGAVLPLTFTTDGSTGPAASVTINVTLYGNGPIGPIVPGVEHVVGNDFNWGISTGALDGPTSLNLSGAVATGANGLQMDVATNVTVDAGHLAAINAAITAGQKGVTLPLKLDTNGFTGTPASTTVNVTLYDNGPQGPIPAGSEHIVGNDFNWGISTGDLTESDAQILSLLAAATAQGFPMSLSSTSMNSAQLDAINAAIAAGKRNTTWPLTFTTDGSTGTAASVTINVTLFDNGPQGPIPAGSEHIVGNNFKWGIDSGNVDASIAQHLGKVLANGATGAPMAATSISIDASELAALNAAIAAGKVGTTWPLTFTTDGSTGTPASVTIYVTLYDAGHQTPIAGDPYIVANHFSRAVSAGSLDDAAAKTHSLVEALSAAGHVGDNAHISVDAAELAVINASIAAADVSKPPYPLTFTYTCPVSSKTVSAVALVTLTGDQDLVVTKSVDNENPLPGETVTYTIEAKNNGNTAIKGLWIKDNVPANTTYVSCDANGLYGATLAGQEYVHWYFDTLNPGQKVILTMTVKINECPAGTEIKNVALYGMDIPGLPANLDDDPSGGKTNAATSKVADAEAAKSRESVLVKGKKIIRTGDDSAGALALVGVGLIAFVLLIAAIRRRREQR